MWKAKGKGIKARAALVAMVVLIAAASVPVAMGAITFDITPDTSAAGARTGYKVDVTTDGYNDTVIISVTLPAGFSVVEPTGPWMEIATAELDGEGGWHAKARFESNKPDYRTKINATIANGATATYIIDPVDYGPGGGAHVGPAEVGGMYLEGDLKLPTETNGGYLNATVKPPDGVTLTDVSLDTKPFVRNPAEPGEYPFNVTVKYGETTETRSDGVDIVPAAALPVLTPIGLLALVGILCVVLAGATMRRKKR